MKTGPKLSRSDAHQADETSASQNDSDLSNITSYARDLRVVGQMLELRNVATADLVFVAGGYMIQGRVKTACRNSLLSFLTNWTKLSGSRFAAASGGRQLSGETVKFRRTVEDISEFDSHARCLRSQANGMPDPYALSQILRSAGAYLDTRKGSSLIGIMLRERDMTIRFETASRRLEEMRQDIDYFYDYWVKMYLRRHKPAQLDFFKDKLPSSLRSENRAESRKRNL